MLRLILRGGYLAVDAAVALECVGQAGVDAGVAGQAGELVEGAGLEGEGGGGRAAALLVRPVAALVHVVAAPALRHALPVGAVELARLAARRLCTAWKHTGNTPLTRTN